ncbi:MAG: WGR domain-containing protein [Gammaproteobacteria bacterium]|nr:WGR domain-containing protein [Gammaproteobacteria bacterium]
MTYLEKIDPANNQARFYSLVIMPNLFGQWTLVREWGRIGQRGQAELEWFETAEAAEGAIAALKSQKRRRGYS